MVMLLEAPSMLLRNFTQTNSNCFILAYLCCSACLSGHIPGNFDERYVLLPSGMSKRFVYTKYEEACRKSQDNCVSRTKFEGI